MLVISTGNCAAWDDGEVSCFISPQTLTSPTPHHEAYVPAAKHRLEEALVLRNLAIWKFPPGNFESCGWILFSRCISSIKAIFTSRTTGKSATGPVLQNSDPTEPSGVSKWRGAEVSLVQENKKSRIDAAGAGDRCTWRTQEARGAGGTNKTKSWGSLEQRPPRQQDLVTPLGRKRLLFQPFKAP